MLLALNPNWWDDWSLYHSCTFDGENKLIIVNPDVTEIDVKTDIYSDWKEWMQLRDNAKFLPAIRTIGGDPIGGGQFAGDLYFLFNGWKLLVDHSCNITGVIFSDDFPTPFQTVVDTNIVTNKVSSLVTAVAGGGTAPTATETAAAVRVELATELARLDVNVSSIQGGLTNTQANMLLEMYNLLGLDPTKPLLVTENSRSAGDITQTIATTATETLVTRV